MRLQWVKAEYLFPLDSGGKIRSYNMLRHINRVADVHYLGFTPLRATSEDPQLRPCAREVHLFHRPLEDHSSPLFFTRVGLNLWSDYPYFIKRNRDDRIRAAVRRCATQQQCELVVCDSLDMSPNIDMALPLPKVLFHHGVETTLWQQRHESATTGLQRRYFRYEARRMARYEAATANRFDLIIVVSDKEREILQNELGVTAPIEVVPTGVDCQFYRPSPTLPVIPKKLLFSGTMGLLSNIDQLLWFASEIYPLVKRRHPDVSFDIVGADPASEVIALGQSDSSIQVTGWVEDIRAYLAQADIYVVPLRVAGGTRLKVYEALAMRKPVVATPYGVEGLPLVHGMHVLLAETPREFADAICRLLEDPGMRTSLATNGWRLVNEECDWSVMANRFLDICRDRFGLN